MSRVCTICTNPNRAGIEEALATQADTIRGISRTFRVSEDALTRHNQAGHITATIALAAEASEATRGDDLLRQVRDLGQRALGILETAEAGGDQRTALAAIREARGCLELLGKVAGQLGADVQVQVDATLIGRGVVEDPQLRELARELRDRAQHRNASPLRDVGEPRALAVGAAPLAD